MTTLVATEDDLRRLLREEIRAALAESRPGGDTLSTEDAARVARRSVARVRAWIASGELSATKRGRVWVVRRVDLEAFLGGTKGTPIAMLAASLGRR